MHVDVRDRGSIPESGRSPGGGHSNRLQYSCLENPRDRGAWRAAVHRVTQSSTWPSDLACTHTLDLKRYKNWAHVLASWKKCKYLKTCPASSSQSTGSLMAAVQPSPFRGAGCWRSAFYLILGGRCPWQWVVGTLPQRDLSSRGQGTCRYGTFLGPGVPPQTDLPSLEGRARNVQNGVLFHSPGMSPGEVSRNPLWVCPEFTSWELSQL